MSKLGSHCCSLSDAGACVHAHRLVPPPPPPPPCSTPAESPKRLRLIASPLRGLSLFQGVLAQRVQAGSHALLSDACADANEHGWPGPTGHTDARSHANAHRNQLLEGVTNLLRPTRLLVLPREQQGATGPRRTKTVAYTTAKQLPGKA